MWGVRKNSTTYLIKELPSILPVTTLEPKQGTMWKKTENQNGYTILIEMRSKEITQANEISGKLIEETDQCCFLKTKNMK